MPNQLEFIPTQESIAHYIDQQPRVELVHVAPALAEKLLASMPGEQRKYRPRRGATYSNDMASGRWTMSDSLICVGVGGELLNGQHRLQAVVLSGCTVPMFMAFNFPREAYRNIDRGFTRTAADAMSHDLTANPTLAAAVARCVISVEAGYGLNASGASLVPSLGEVEDLLRDDPTIIEAVDADHPWNVMRCGIAPRVLVYAYRLILANVRAQDGHWVDEFFTKLRTLDNEPAGSGVQVLRNRQAGRHPIPNNEPDRQLLMVIKAWNQWAGNVTARQFEIPEGAAARALPVLVGHVSR